MAPNSKVPRKVSASRPKSPPTIHSTSPQAPTSSRLFSPRNLLTTRTDHPVQKDITILAISDTHSLHKEITNPLPRTKGDIFIHAGDLTANGTEEELEDSLQWIKDVTRNFKFVFYIGGNHDIALTKPEVVERITRKYPKLIFLENRLTEVMVKGRKLRIYGSSKSPRHSKKSYAFTYERNTKEDVWGCIPNNVDILVTHCPPFDLCDEREKRLGCLKLRQACWKVKPQLLICGHIHTGRGSEIINWGETPEKSAKFIACYTRKRVGIFTSDMPSRLRRGMSRSLNKLLPEALAGHLSRSPRDNDVNQRPSTTSPAPSEPPLVPEYEVKEIIAVRVPADSKEKGFTTVVNSASLMRNTDGLRRNATLIII